jgi:DNA mismatch repair protein MutL
VNLPKDIKLLPEHVANQIAAGEVVQRPASVVKELLENAIDAGATQITLVLKGAGKTLIQVIDNGSGMTPENVSLCFARHATSKISSAEDLFALTTKGFRGEAMASIAAIAHVSLKTKTQQAPQGIECVIEGSEVVAQSPCVMPAGTVVTVKNLFYNIPARRNFLKGDHVELKHCIEEFQRVALAHSQIGFKMVHGDQDLFHYASANMRQRIAAVLGGKSNQRLVPVEENTEIVSVSGFVLKPEFAKKSRGDQYFFVNNRFIKSPYLNHAVNAAFEGMIKSELYPGYVLFLKVDPAAIDINIHPTKTEVKFEEEQSIYAVLRACVKHSLGQFNIMPLLDFERDASMDTTYSSQGQLPKTPQIEVDPDFNPFTGASNYRPKEEKGSWSSLYVGLKAEEPWHSLEVESQEVTGALFEDETQESDQITVQIQNKFIVTTIKRGLIVVHQNLAHQRIIYERLLRTSTLDQGSAQKKLFSIEIELSPIQSMYASEIQDTLKSLGFDFEIKENIMALTAVPAGLSESQAKGVILELIDESLNNRPDDGFGLMDTIVRSLAAKMAIKTGHKLKLTEQRDLINELFACKEPDRSPSQRRTFITLDAQDLEQKFI